MILRELLILKDIEESRYEWNEKKTFKVKSQIRNRTITDENGKKVEIREKLVCFWSKKHYDKQLKENAKFIEYLNKVIRCPEKIKGKTKKDREILKKTEVYKDTGEIMDIETCLSIDSDKIQECLNLLGYYTIMTSEVYKTDREIIHKYHGLSRIEDSFSISKSDLEGRPVYVRNPKHINAHFLICFIELTMIRIIQFRILKFQGKDTLNENGWESGLTAERIRNALYISFQADLLPGGRYRLTRLSDDFKMILESFHINADFHMSTTTELCTLKYNFDKAGII